MSWDNTQSIPERFTQQVAAYPDRLAVHTKNYACTYAELDQTANRVARALLHQYGRREEPVALLLERDAPLLAALMGVLKAGKIYVPLDLSFPPDRLAVMLADANASVLITDQQHGAFAQTLVPEVCDILTLEALRDGYTADGIDLGLSADTLACILYTSGSTGRPKGVVHNHRTILHFIAHYSHRFHISAHDRLTLLYSNSTMGGLRDTFSALLNGATLYPFDVRQEGLEAVAPWLQSAQITIWNAVVTLFRHFTQSLSGAEAFPTIRLVKFGGEQATRRDIELFKRHFPPGCRLYFGLGTTETFTFRDYCIDTETPLTWDIAPAGYAMEDMEVCILDENGTDVGIDQVGEIAVRSRYLSLGYWRRPELTRTVFLAETQSDAVRTYLTGDLGRLRPDGCLEHLGRKDFQVKIRGYRVEVMEVELALQGHAGIKEAVVVARQAPDGDNRLVAYVVATDQPPPPVSDLRTLLQTQLPQHMIPTTFVFLEALPLTANGKLDRRALPVPDWSRLAVETAFVAPRTPLEHELSHLWTEVLGLQRVGIHETFLELGGDSLLATRLIGRVRTALHVDAPLGTLLQASTVAEMALTIMQYQAAQTPAEELARLLEEIEEKDSES